MKMQSQTMDIRAVTDEGDLDLLVLIAQSYSKTPEELGVSRNQLSRDLNETGDNRSGNISGSRSQNADGSDAGSG